MPAILTKTQESLWIDMELPPEDALSIIAPYPEDLIRAYPVSKRVGKVSENDADIIKPVSLSGDSNQDDQSTLF
jgi:putative SOS response-associated peptidase YedK